VGTQMGIVAVWRYTGHARDLSPNNKQPTTPTAAGEWEVSSLRTLYYDNTH
jgi:hypothetical protein